MARCMGTSQTPCLPASWYSWPPTRRTVAFCPGDLYALRRGTRSRLTSAKTTTLRRPGATSSDRRKLHAQMVVLTLFG
eukprot:1139526-Pelagomonas_calceolata.AAC.5